MAKTEIGVRAVKEISNAKRSDVRRTGLKEREVSLASEVRRVGQQSAEKKIGTRSARAELGRIQKDLHFTGNQDVKKNDPKSNWLKTKEKDTKHWDDKVDHYTKTLQQNIVKNQDTSQTIRDLNHAKKKLDRAVLEQKWADNAEKRNNKAPKGI